VGTTLPRRSPSSYGVERSCSPPLQDFRCDIRARLAIGRERVDFRPGEARRMEASLVRAVEIAGSKIFL
jgi:hypothetical protein